MTRNSKSNQIEEIKCKRCNQVNYVNPSIVHGENGDPFQLHCTYCKAEIESKVVLLDKVTIITNTAFLMNQIFYRANTIESDSLDGKLFRWVRRQHEESWRKSGRGERNTRDSVKVTFELSEDTYRCDGWNVSRNCLKLAKLRICSGCNQALCEHCFREHKQEVADND
jgi:hypothetical protein